MLPRLLCEELCSLNPMTDKLTFSVIWTLTPEGKVTTYILPFILCLPASHTELGEAPTVSLALGCRAAMEGWEGSVRALASADRQPRRGGRSPFLPETKWRRWVSVRVGVHWEARGPAAGKEHGLGEEDIGEWGEFAKMCNIKLGKI